MITRRPGKNVAKTKPAEQVEVSFTVPPGHLPDGQAVSVVGDFNAWDPTAHPLKPRADGYEPNGAGATNCILDLTTPTSPAPGPEAPSLSSSADLGV